MQSLHYPRHMWSHDFLPGTAHIAMNFAQISRLLHRNGLKVSEISTDFIDLLWLQIAPTTSSTWNLAFLQPIYLPLPKGYLMSGCTLTMTSQLLFFICRSSCKCDGFLQCTTKSSMNRKPGISHSGHTQAARHKIASRCHKFPSFLESQETLNKL